MRFDRRITSVDIHADGMPGRVITGGVDDVPGATMLEKARRRVARLGLRNVERLAVMDAEHLDFPDASFDVIVAQYVVTAVPNPEAALDEFARVLRPGGEIVITVDADAAAAAARGCGGPLPDSLATGGFSI